MPLIDVAELTLDPDFAQSLTIERRTETVGDNGRVVQGKQIITPKPIGVVVPMPDPWIERGSDEQHGRDSIEVHTQFRLRGPSPNWQPDVIVHGGSRFVVMHVHDYSDFGVGFVSAQASSMESTDPPPAEFVDP